MARRHATAFRLNFAEGGEEPALWLQEVAGSGAPPPAVFPSWPPPEGMVVVVLVAGVVGGVAATVDAVVVLSRDRLDEFAAVDASARKLFFAVPAARLADAVPSLADAIENRKH